MKILGEIGLRLGGVYFEGCLFRWIEILVFVFIVAGCQGFGCFGEVPTLS